MLKYTALLNEEFRRSASISSMKNKSRNKHNNRDHEEKKFNSNLMLGDYAMMTEPHFHELKIARNHPTTENEKIRSYSQFAKEHTNSTYRSDDKINDKNRHLLIKHPVRSQSSMKRYDQSERKPSKNLQIYSRNQKQQQRIQANEKQQRVFSQLNINDIEVKKLVHLNKKSEQNHQKGVQSHNYRTNNENFSMRMSALNNLESIQKKIKMSLGNNDPKLKIRNLQH